MVVYPPGEITPLGLDILTAGEQPMCGYKSYDGGTEFHLMGGLAPWPGVTEGVLIKEIKGLIPPWKTIDQKGATQDGVTFVDALYDPIEVDMVVEAAGNTPQSTRQVIRDWIDSWDVKQPGELWWSTPELGRWWAPVRWLKSPLDKLNRATACGQEFGMVARADNGFWRTYDNTAQFGFTYESMIDTFDTDYSGSSNLGPNWPLSYTGTGGYISTTTGVLNIHQARWYESGTAAREVVAGPYKDFSTTTDNQVVEMVLGTFPEVTLFEGAWSDLWGRMSRDGSGNWTGYGIRARIGMFGIFPWVILSRFNNFIETVMAQGAMIIQPLPSEKYTLVCGDEGNPRRFQVQRNGLPILNHVEMGAGSALGSAYRGVGFGMRAGSGLLSQASPAWVRKVNAGDNATVSQTGFLPRSNIGDQPMYDDYTCFGPGTFRFANGPGSSDMIEFGPLLGNQVAFIRTDPRKRTVQDLTSVPPTPQDLNAFQAALQQFISFATGNNVPPLLQAIESLFGIAPPQGNFYSLLKGRFSDAAAIPAKSPGNPAQPYYVKVEIDGGNAASKIIASGTPLRRYPM